MCRNRDGVNQVHQASRLGWSMLVCWLSCAGKEVHAVHLPPYTAGFSGPKSPGINWFVCFELIITPSSTVSVGSLIAFPVCPSLLASIVLNYVADDKKIHPGEVKGIYDVRDPCK